MPETLFDDCLLFITNVNFFRYLVEKTEHDQFVSLTLKISRLTEEDFGQYNCTAFNEAGITSKILFLDREGQEQVPVLIAMTAGSSILMLVLLIVLCIVCCYCRSRSESVSRSLPCSFSTPPTLCQSQSRLSLGFEAHSCLY